MNNEHHKKNMNVIFLCTYFDAAGFSSRIAKMKNYIFFYLPNVTSVHIQFQLIKCLTFARTKTHSFAHMPRMQQVKATEPQLKYNIFSLYVHFDEKGSTNFAQLRDDDEE
ncbi:hypothetical protein ACKWTF_000653 [Chironomus riparius]